MKKSTHPTVITSGAECNGSRFSFLAGTAILGVSLLLASCTTPRESHRVSAPPPAAPTRDATSTPTQVVVTTNAPDDRNVRQVTTPTTSMIIVNQAPPVPPPEAVVAQPSAAHVWIPGYWTWRNERYEWMAGHWEVPPGKDAKWVNPRWEKDGNAYRFYEGYWD